MPVLSHHGTPNGFRYPGSCSGKYIIFNAILWLFIPNPKSSKQDFDPDEILNTDPEDQSIVSMELNLAGIQLYTNIFRSFLSRSMMIFLHSV